jgi:hypothetical protein
MTLENLQGISKTAASQRLRTLICLLCICCMLPLSGHAQSASVQSSPHMSGVNDVLGGKTTLLEQSDAAVVLVNQPMGDVYNPAIIPFDSANSGLQQGATFSLPPVDNNTFYNPYAADSVLASSASGRMFNNGNDVIMSLSATILAPGDNLGYTWLYTYYNPATGNTQTYPLQAALQPNSSHIVTKVVMGNFQGNNLVEPLMFAETNFGGYVLWQMNIIPVTSPDQVDQVNAQGGTQTISEDDQSPAPYPLGQTIVTGDFDGDGRDEIAVMLSDFKTIKIYKVSLPALNISLSQTIVLPVALASPVTPVYIPHATLAAGRYGNSSNVYLAAVGQGPNNNQATVDFIDTHISPATITSTTYNVPGQNSQNVNGVFAQAAPIANFASSNGQQLVLGLTYTYGSFHSIEIGSFDESKIFTMQVSQARDGCLLGMQVGNYNHQKSGSAPSPDNIDPTLELNLLENDGSGSGCESPYGNGFLQLNVFNVSPSTTPSNFTINQVSSLTPDLGSYSQLQTGALALISGDFQGRSLRLGAPEKITLMSHTQPDFVLGMPPMHVDWINPTTQLSALVCDSQLSNGACVANLTVKPYPEMSLGIPSFSSSYSVSQTDTSSSTRKSTSSWSFGVKLSTGITEQFGQKDVATTSISLKGSAGNTYNSVASAYNSGYSAQTESLSSATVFDDDIYFTSETQNIFSYPVLGQTDSKGNPLYVLYSVPSQITTAELSGSTLEWYQPVHEPGNVLSYPSSETMLSDHFQPGTITTQAASVCTQPGSGTSTSAISWSNSKKTVTNTGWNDALSENLDASVSAGATPSVLDGGVGGKISASIDVSNSNAWGALNQSTAELTSSHAVVISNPQFNKDVSAITGYAMQSFVFGSQNATQVFQNPSSILPAGLDITTSGPLFTNFIANPTTGNNGVQCSQSGSNWWSSVYNLPDVGFNHPERWDVDRTNHVTFNSFDPTTPILEQLGYHMKGFFITTTGANNSSTPGQTVTSVTAGQKVLLTARVYNYSLVATNALDPSTTVHVRFYVQHRSTLTRADGSKLPTIDSGGAVVVQAGGRDGDYVIGSIPGFGGTSPNYASASSTFDTTGYDNAELIFWVVTWIEDGNGNVVAEMPDHGVNLKSFVGQNFSGITDIPIQAHSNNVGLYGSNTPFFVEPAASSQLQPASLAIRRLNTAADQGGGLENISMSAPPRMELDRKSVVTADFVAGTDFPGSVVRYYDGDPGAKGTLVDLQFIHALASGSDTAGRVHVRPLTCGPHTLYAVSDVEGAPTVTGKTSTFVDIDVPAKIDSMSLAIAGAPLPASTKAELIDLLEQARTHFAALETQAALDALHQFELLLYPFATDTSSPALNVSEELHAESVAFRSCELALPPPVSTLALTPTALNFGQVSVGSISAEHTVMLSNTGTASLTISGFGFTGSQGFQQTNNCGGPLAAGSSCTISVSCAPTITGNLMGMLTANYKSSLAQQTVALTCMSIALTAPPDFTLQSTPSGRTVASTGSAIFALTLSSLQGAFTQPVTLTASGLPPGATATFSPASVTPGASGATTTLTIQTTPQRTSMSEPWTWASPALGAILLIWIPRRRWLLGLVPFLMLTILGCGSTTNITSMPASATYTVTVTGTSGAVVHSTSLQLTVGGTEGP